MTKPCRPVLAAILLLCCAASALAAGGAPLVVQDILKRMEVVGLRFDVQFGRPWRTLSIAPAPMLDPAFREQLAFYLYFQQGRDVDLYFQDKMVVGAGLPGAPPFLGIVDGAPVAVASPETVPEIVGELSVQGAPAWRERPAVVAFFENKSLAAADIGKRPEEIEAAYGLSLAADGTAVYRERPASREATLAYVGLDASGRVQALAGYLLFVSGRAMTGYPAAKAITALVGPADDVTVQDGGDLVMRYFVSVGGRNLEYTLEMRSLSGQPETGKDYFGFEIVGRIVDAGEAIVGAKAVAR
jgi:hypothetical protein